MLMRPDWRCCTCCCCWLQGICDVVTMSFLLGVAEMGSQMEDGKLLRGAGLPCSDWRLPEQLQLRGKGRVDLHQLWQLMVGWVLPLKLLLPPLPQTGKLSPFYQQPPPQISQSQ